MEDWNQPLKLRGFVIILSKRRSLKRFISLPNLKPLCNDTITKRALIPYVLKEGTKSYPKRQLLRRKLDDLYGGMFSADGSKKGENHIITIRLELANPKFLPDNPAILEEGIALFKELLFHPIAEWQSFHSGDY